LDAQPKENPATTAANLEAQRFGDQVDAALNRAKEARKRAEEAKDTSGLMPAYEELSPFCLQRDKLSPARDRQMLDELDYLARKVLYSQESYFSQPYVVTNESLATIAKPLGISPELLIKINDIKRPDEIRGRQIKVVHGPFHAELRRSKFELTLLAGDKRLYAGRFKVGIGPEGAEPGTYKVTQKQMFPIYHPNPKDRSVKIPGNDPRNALGSRLIVFLSAEEKDGAFHGTNDPLSLGKPCKEGGVRLGPREIEDLYDMLIENESQVIVRE
jgi:hypothetical protein